MAKSFYSVYFSNGSSNLKLGNGQLSEMNASSIICIAHGFSWRYAVPYLGAITALGRRQYFPALVLFGFSFLIATVSKTLVYTMPNINNIIILFSSYLAGMYGPTLVESNIASKDVVFAGIYLAESEDEAIKAFYTSAEPSLKEKKGKDIKKFVVAKKPADKKSSSKN